MRGEHRRSACLWLHKAIFFGTTRGCAAASTARTAGRLNGTPSLGGFWALTKESRNCNRPHALSTPRACSIDPHLRDHPLDARHA